MKLKSYDNVLEELKKYVARPDIKIWVGTEYTNYALYEIIKPMVCTDFFFLDYFFVSSGLKELAHFLQSLDL